MPLKLPVSQPSGDFKRVPAGSHIAVCNLVADMGLQPGSAVYPDPKRKLYIRFEIPAERVEYEKDGQKLEGPLAIGSFYTASMHEKATLRKHLEGWRGTKFTDAEAAAFDVASILGKACMLSVVETTRGDKTYANIAGIGKLPKGMPAPAAENPLLYYDKTSDLAAFNALPDWLQKKIGEQLQPPTEQAADEAAAAQHAATFDDDDVPF